jgi:hypothetical protein
VILDADWLWFSTPTLSPELAYRDLLSAVELGGLGHFRIQDMAGGVKRQGLFNQLRSPT